MRFFWTFFSSKNAENYQCFHKNIKQHNCFKRCFLSTKSMCQNDFWKIMWLWSEAFENSVLPSGINYINILKILILNDNNISQYYYLPCIFIRIRNFNPKVLNLCEFKFYIHFKCFIYSYKCFNQDFRFIWIFKWLKSSGTWQGLDHKEQQDILSIWFVSVLCCITRNINILTGCNISPCWTATFLVAGNLEHSIMHQPPRSIQTMKTKIIWTSASEEWESLSLSVHPVYIWTHQSEIIWHFSAVKLAPVKAPVTISGDICLVFFLFPSHIFFSIVLEQVLLCVFVCVHVCAAVVKGFSNVMYYLSNMSEASQFFAYGSKGLPCA